MRRTKRFLLDATQRTVYNESDVFFSIDANYNAN